jgi:hypothetical protein
MVPKAISYDLGLGTILTNKLHPNTMLGGTGLLREENGITNENGELGATDFNRLDRLSADGLHA